MERIGASDRVSADVEGGTVAGSGGEPHADAEPTVA